eukprot:1833034-Alexandrium_andersonii.AAC.1
MNPPPPGPTSPSRAAPRRTWAGCGSVRSSSRKRGRSCRSWAATASISGWPRTRRTARGPPARSEDLLRDTEPALQDNELILEQIQQVKGSEGNNNAKDKEQGTIIQVEEMPVAASFQESYEEAGTKPDEEASREAAGAARALALAAQAAAQGQVVSESILPQGQPMVDSTAKTRTEQAAAPLAAAQPLVEGSPTVAQQGAQAQVAGAAAPVGARSRLGPGEVAPLQPPPTSSSLQQSIGGQQEEETERGGSARGSCVRGSSGPRQSARCCRRTRRGCSGS